MAILLYAVETELRDELDSADPTFLKQAARAYRARGDALRADGQLAAARADAKRAEKLEADAQKAAKTAKRPSSEAESAEAPKTGRIVLVNAWTEPVTVLVEGRAYSVPAGDRRAITRAPGEFEYEVPAAQHQGKARVEAGKTFTIRIAPR
ncbi:MAG TPA: hypothetical protein VG013_10510 [Gemmataceae bacterium]|jgi:ATPase subunit of ABC transporter with duplicated ATPase domains|nr:hypothetical protein [Gemmataceae bacterium]